MTADDEQLVREDEELLRELGGSVRAVERTADVARLEALCRGELPAAERAALERAAESDASVARAVSAYAPLSKDMQHRLAAQAARAVHAQQPAQERPSFRFIVRCFAFGVPLAAAGMALMLWIGRPAELGPQLPEYALEITGAAAELRGATQPAPTSATKALQVGQDTRLQVVLRPPRAVETKLRAMAFLLRGGSEPLPWPAEVAASAAGAVRLSLAPSPSAITGASELRIVLGGAAMSEADARTLVQGDVDQGPGFQRFRVPLVPAEH